MADIHISEFSQGRTQAEIALILGVTQGAVHQMIKSGRDIYFRPIDSGGFEFYEIKKPRGKKAA